MHEGAALQASPGDGVECLDQGAAGCSAGLLSGSLSFGLPLAASPRAEQEQLRGALSTCGVDTCSLGLWDCVSS